MSPPGAQVEVAVFRVEAARAVRAANDGDGAQGGANAARGNARNRGFGIEQHGNLPTERGGLFQPFTRRRQRDAREIRAYAVAVFVEVSGRVTDGERVMPDEPGSLEIRIG